MKFSIVIVMSLSVIVNGVMAQTDSDYDAPKNAWGDPDLSGVWNFASNTPMQRPEKWGDQEFLTSEQLQEEITRQQARAQAADERAAKAVDLDADLPTGPQVPVSYTHLTLPTILRV